MDKTISIMGEDKRLLEIADQIVRLANADFTRQGEISEKGDDLDSIVVGLNLLGEELESHIDQANQREAELKEALCRLNEAQQLALIGSWEWDIQLNKIEWTDQLYRLYGVEREAFDTSYENYLKYIHPEDTDFVNGMVQKAYQDQLPFNFYHQIIRSDGEIRVMHARGAVFANVKGEPIKMTGTAQDVTELKKVEEKLTAYNKALEQKNKETEQFAYIASHDLQEPLRTITNYIGLFYDDYKGKLDDNADKYLDFISGASKRMQVLITDLLEYTRIEKDKSPIEVDINALVKDVLKDMEQTIAETNAKIELQNLPVMTGFTSRLRSLFQNLISNAIKFKKDDVAPIIKIIAKDLGKEWLFEISDNGIGIEKIYHEKIFKLFQRLHTRAEYQGTGIGLAHCKKIVDLRGGRIWVESELGEGSKFFFIIPKKILL